MKSKITGLFPLLCFLTLTACGGGVTPSPTPDAGRKGMSGIITLKVGEEITFEDAGITLRLNAVTEDSRCPTTVRCVHAGWVTVDLSMIENGEQTGQFFFTLPAEREDQSSEVRIDNLTIRLLEVNPYPTSPGPIAQSEYRVELEVVQ